MGRAAERLGGRHGLARVARWNGQTEGTHIFSVAQHSLFVEAISRKTAPNLDLRWRRAVLLHDAPEYVIGDLISPFKAILKDDYKKVEARLLHAVSLRFGLPARWPLQLEKIVKAADRSAAFMEATKLAGFAESEARRFFGRPPTLNIAAIKYYLMPWSAETAKRRFIRRFKELAGPDA